jgi:uncharacterized alpha/beta hydrolase family protein
MHVHVNGELERMRKETVIHILFESNTKSTQDLHRGLKENCENPVATFKSPRQDSVWPGGGASPPNANPFGTT